MTVKKILFRADAKPSIGTGDLISLIHLSMYFKKDGWEVYFMIRNYRTGVSIAEKYGVRNLFLIDGGISIADEISEINKYIEKYAINVIFFEITERALTEYTGIVGNVHKACVCFDDRIPDDIALVVNWDADAHKLFNASLYAQTKFLLGPEYVVLSPDFDMEKVKYRRFNANAKNIMVAMGGADEFDFTSKVVDYFINIKPDFKIRIIIGSGYAYKDKLIGKLENSSLDYEIMSNITNMFDQYMEADIVIGAGGLTLYEIIATRTPGIVFSLYKHQMARCRYSHDKGFIKHMGFRNFDEILLAKYLEELNSLKYSLMPFAMKTNEIVEACDALAK